MKTRLGVKVLIVLKILTIESIVWARQDLIPGSRYTSARAAGMADAFLPLGEDVASGLFYNPANLGRLRRASFEPFNFTMGVNQGFVSLADAQVTNAFTLNQYTSKLDSVPGTYSGFNGSFTPTFGFPGFALGVHIGSESIAKSNGDGTITYRSMNQIIPTIGGGYKFWSGILRVGYSLQWVNQSSGSVTVQSSEAQGYDKGLAKGSTLSHNFGVALTAPLRSLPSLNLVVRNALGSSFRTYSIIPIGDGVQGLPATDPMTVDASFSVQPRLGHGTVMTISLVNRDVTNRSGVAFMGHIALGAEISFKDVILLRGGWGGGYPALGLGFKRPGAELSLAWFSQEVGSYYLEQKNTQYLLQYQIRAF